MGEPRRETPSRSERENEEQSPDSRPDDRHPYHNLEKSEEDETSEAEEDNLHRRRCGDRAGPGLGRLLGNINRHTLLWRGGSRAGVWRRHSGPSGWKGPSWTARRRRA